VSASAGHQRAAILGFAAATPVGYALEPTLAAMGANLSHISASPVRTLDGEPAPVSCLLDPAMPRAERFARLFEHGLADLRALLSAHGIESAPLLLGLPAGLDSAARADIVAVQHGAGFRTPDDALFAYGRASAFAALAHALPLLQQRQHRCVIVGGLDSLCAPASVEALVHARRVLEPFTEGTIPGEAASFVALLQPDDAAVDPDHALWLDGVAVARGSGFEAAERVEAEGLTRVLHRLAKTAGEADAEADGEARRVHRVVAAHSGEGYFGRSFSLACLRAVDLMPEPLEVTLTADRVGDVGAASGALGMAFAAYLMVRELQSRPGPRRALVYTESDGGEVGAAVLHGRPRTWKRTGLSSGA